MIIFGGYDHHGGSGHPKGDLKQIGKVIMEKSDKVID